MNLKKLYIIRIAAISLLLCGVSVSQSAVSQNSNNNNAFYCIYVSEKSKIRVYSDIVMFTRSFHAGWTAGDKPKDDRPYSTYRPEFLAYMATKRVDDKDGHVGCDDFDTAALAENDRARKLGDWKDYTASIATGWRPVSLSAPVPASQKPTTAAPKQNEHILVRDPETATVVKTVPKPAPKPVAKAEPVAKPSPKKPTTRCGRKGQRNCGARPM